MASVARPRLLDLFCCAGGAGMGFYRAGFEVVGVDIKPQPHYPFEFHQADALEYAAEHGREFGAIHASPPCQKYSVMSWRDDHPDLYVPTRNLLLKLQRPWTLENVIGAPYGYGVILCGSMFGMKVRRHRSFETSWLMFQPDHPCKFSERPFTITGHGDTREGNYKHSRHPAKSEGPALMGMPWASWEEVREAIPPAYTEFIGRLMIETL